MMLSQLRKTISTDSCYFMHNIFPNSNLFNDAVSNTDKLSVTRVVTSHITYLWMLTLGPIWSRNLKIFHTIVI